MLRALAAPGSRARTMHFDRTAETVKTGIRNYFSSRDISSFRLNSLGPLCLWQCLIHNLKERVLCCILSKTLSFCSQNLTQLFVHE